MSSSFLKNFKNLVKKQYSCELTESAKMKTALHRFKKEYSIRDPDILNRFPKKELKVFIKIECPTLTNDENLKEQEIQFSLKRLRALNGVKEDLVCQNCSKKDTCKIVNFVPEINEHTSKTSLSDLLTSMYYFAVEIEAKGTNQVETEQKKLEEEINQAKKGQDKFNKQNDKDKADISVQKYRDCQTESSFYKSCTSANKLTDTFHQVLDDLYNNLGIETKKFNNEFIEEEKRRRFMERIYRKLEKDIESDNLLKKREFYDKFGASKTQKGSEEGDRDDDEVRAHPLTKKNERYQSKQKLYEEEQEADHDNKDEEYDDGPSFVQVAGKNKQNKKSGLLDQIMDSNPAEGKNYHKMKQSYNSNQSDDEDQISSKKSRNSIREEKPQYRDNNSSSGKYDRQQSSSKYSERRDSKQYNNQDSKPQYNKDSRSQYNKEGRSQYSKDGRSQYNKEDRPQYNKEDRPQFNKDGKRPQYNKENNFSQNKYDRSERSQSTYQNRKDNDQDRDQSQGRRERFNKSDRNSGSYSKNDSIDSRYYSKKQLDERADNSSYKRDSYKSSRQEDRSQNKYSQNAQNDRPREENFKENKPSFDRLQSLDDSKFNKFMYKDSQDQKSKITKEIQQKNQEKEERKAQRFEKDFEQVQQIVKESSDDMLVREVDRKKSPRYSRGSFKFSKTVKND